tara:strand:+ start:5692 stop:6516 length:825 start_codon:yes stop_codon:yes gene_type:complete
MDIQVGDIELGNIQVRRVEIFPINNLTPTVLSAPTYVPVVVDIGLPIVNVPGCVEAHESNNPRNNKLVSDDPKGTLTFCDAGVPNFSPIQYEPEQMIITRPPPVDTRTGEKEPKSESEGLSTPKGAEAPPTNTANIECPTQEQLSKEPIGFIFDSGRKEVTGYRLEGTQCIREVRDVPIIDQAINGLPPTSVVITTGGIAVVATTSALLAKPFADILLKVIKPTVKKVLKKVASIRGKKQKVESVMERRAEQRLRNEAIAKLRSVVAKSQKKKK